MCQALGTELVAEGVETAEEYRTLRELGVRYMQGYLLARPGFETFPRVVAPEMTEKTPSPMEFLFSGFDGLFQTENGVMLA